jgi:hypothetical protein
VIVQVLNEINMGYIGRIKWDVERFVDRVTKKRVNATDAMDDTIKKFFGETDNLEFSEPCTFIDMHGVIMVWYLPGVLGPKRIVRTVSSFTAATNVIAHHRKALTTQ